nr:zincin-like metallopeptidase domain-containing protein [Belnapia moabensis]
MQMPSFADFGTAGGYYATLAHEVTHWTGTPPGWRAT